jgi:hypothetical protein
VTALLAVAAAGLLGACRECYPLAPPPIPRVGITLGVSHVRPSDTLFPWSTGCVRVFVSDRAYDNKVAVYAVHYTNHFLVGDSLLSLKKDCHEAYASHRLANPEAFDDETWIAATWTPDGRKVMAIGHHEYHGEQHPGRCAGNSPRQCRYGVLLHLISTDGGVTFRKSTPTPIAAAPVRSEPNQTREAGFFQPSNIFEHDGFEYTFVRTTGGGTQKPATCLMRSADPTDAKSWTIYDGREFVPALFNPYTEDVKDREPCAQIPALNGLVWSVLTYRESGVLLAVISVIDPQTKEARLATSTSYDGLLWSKPLYVKGFDLDWIAPCPRSPQLFYPSLIDPASKRRNFDDTGGNPVLFVTGITREGCKSSMERDLRFAHVRLVPTN